MAIRISTGLQNDIANNISQTANFGGATFAVYTGTQPANANSAATGTKLVQYALDTLTGGAAASNGVVTISGTPVTATAIASGTAGWGRLVMGTWTIDGTVGTTGTDFIIDSTTITNGSVYAISALTFTMPAS